MKELLDVHAMGTGYCTGVPGTSRTLYVTYTGIKILKSLVKKKKELGCYCMFIIC